MHVQDRREQACMTEMHVVLPCVQAEADRIRETTGGGPAPVIGAGPSGW